jgi:hypothetical protein
MITEKLMGTGGFELHLVSGVRRSGVLSQVDVRRRGVGLGHVVVTPTPMDPLAVTDDEMLANARFVGVYRSQPSEFALAGVGVNSWLGDHEGKGRSLGVLGTPGTGSFADWRNQLVSLTHGLTAGVTSTIPGTYPKNFFRTVPREVIDDLAERFGAEWRVTNQFTLDFGLPADLFRAVPVATIVRDRGLAGRDPATIGVVGDLDESRDLEDWSRRVVYFTGTEGSPTASIADGSIATADTPYRAPDGQYAFIDRVIEDFGDTPTSSGPAFAAAQYGRFNTARRQITLGSLEYDIGRDVNVGDNVYVYDPLRGITDMNNPVPYRGTTIYPEVIRCVGMTYPIREGMGVYLRRYVDNNTETWPVTYVDLTPYVEWENRETTVEIGAKPRR